MAVSSVSLNTALDQQSKTTAATDQLAGDFSDFLTLLTVQLQHQDPLDPMDTAQFTNQLVAFAGVEQQINSNQKLDSLVSLGLGNALGAAQSYIGKEVSYVSTEFNYTGAQQKIKYSMGGEAKTSKISIMDESGATIYSTDGAKTVGVHDFAWDGTMTGGGKAPPGTYEIKIDALDVNGEAVDSTSVVSGIVRGTETQDGAIYLLVGDRAVALSNVLNSGNNSNGGGSNEGLTMALSYVGMDVTYNDDEINFDGTTQVPINYSLDADADRSQVIIKDDSGNVVYSKDVYTTEGDHSFTWTGIKNDGTQAAAGQYSVSIEAIDANDQHIATTTVGAGQVTGVETNNGDIYLNIGSKSVALIDILSANIHEDA